MVKIRLRRVGKIHSPFYQVVVITDRQANNARFLEKVGFYFPLKEQFELNDDRILHWLSKGAQPSQTVRNLLAKKKIMTTFHNLKNSAKTPTNLKKTVDMTVKKPSAKQKNVALKAKSTS